VLGGAGVEDHQRAGGVEVEGGEQLVESPLGHGARREAWVAGGQVDTGHRAADGGIVEEAVVAAVVEGHPLIESLAVAVVRANALGGAGHGNELAADLVTFDGDGEASPGAPQLADKSGKLAQGLPAMPVLAGGAWEVDDMAAESRRFDDVPV